MQAFVGLTSAVFTAYDNNNDDGGVTNEGYWFQPCSLTRALISVKAAHMSKQVSVPMFTTRCSTGHKKATKSASFDV